MRRVIPPYPKAGDRRTRRFFAVVPFRTYPGDGKVAESRWLEWVTVEEEFRSTTRGSRWLAKRFVESTP